jgi:hypothetical protein
MFHCILGYCVIVISSHDKTPIIRPILPGHQLQDNMSFVYFSLLVQVVYRYLMAINNYTKQPTAIITKSIWISSGEYDEELCLIQTETSVELYCILYGRFQPEVKTSWICWQFTLSVYVSLFMAWVSTKVKSTPYHHYYIKTTSLTDVCSLRVSDGSDTS